MPPPMMPQQMQDPMPEETEPKGQGTQIDVHLSLTEQEANDILAMLTENGLDDVAAMVKQAIDQAPHADDMKALQDEVIAADGLKG